MRDWFFGGNALKRYMHGHIELIEQPWWLSVIEWWSDHACSFIPRIPFPNFPKRKWKGGGEEECTPKEWWGDLGQWYCGTVSMPLLQWVFHHPKRKTYIFDVGWDKLKEIMYEYDKEYFDEHEKMCIEMEKEDEEEKEK